MISSEGTVTCECLPGLKINLATCSTELLHLPLIPTSHPRPTSVHYVTRSSPCLMPTSLIYPSPYPAPHYPDNLPSFTLCPSYFPSSLYLCLPPFTSLPQPLPGSPSLPPSPGWPHGRQQYRCSRAGPGRLRHGPCKSCPPADRYQNSCMI